MLFLLVKENSLKVRVKIIESKSYRYSFSLEESYINGIPFHINFDF